ncbi:unnamed protein product [Symbiodinium sp. CCMP2456]|nr:unnamed protein product [Symbiodinium sp. CCMP2456]
MWPMNEKGKLRKPSTDAIKLNKILLRHFVPNFASHPQVARIPVIAPVLAMIAKEFGVQILEPQINADAHAIKSFLIAHKRLMERSDVQRDPDVQMLSVLGVANACMNMADLYRARLGDEGALAVYRQAHRPNHRRRAAGPEEANDEEGGELEEEGEEGEEGEEAAPDDAATEPEGEGVHEGPNVAPWLGVAAIFDLPDGESDPELEGDGSSMCSEERFGADLLSAPSVGSSDPDSQDTMTGGEFE